MTPAVAGDTAYLGSCSGVYYAFEVRTGSIAWSYDFKQEVGHATFHGDPLLTDELVITGTEALDPVQMRAFDQSSGRVAWARKGEWALTRSDIVGLGTLAVGRNDRGELVALDARSGALIWHVSHEGRAFPPDVAESPAVWDSAIVYSAPDGKLYRIAGGSGTVRWSVPLGCDVSTSVAIEGDDLYVGCTDGRLFRISARTGEVIATLSLNRRLEGRLAVLSDGVIVPGGRAWIGAIDRNLSDVIWARSDLLPLSVVQPLVWRDAVLTGTGDGQLVALDRQDGRTVWSVQLEGSIRGLGHTRGILLVGTIQGTLYALADTP